MLIPDLKQIFEVFALSTFHFKDNLVSTKSKQINYMNIFIYHAWYVTTYWMKIAGKIPEKEPAFFISVIFKYKNKYDYKLTKFECPSSLLCMSSRKSDHE